MSLFINKLFGLVKGIFKGSHKDNSHKENQDKLPEPLIQSESVHESVTQPEPMHEQVHEPQHEPIIQPEPLHEPVPVHEPMPEHKHEPVPQHESELEPVPQPEPVLEPELVHEPVPTPEPIHEPEHESEREPVLEPEVEPVHESVPDELYAQKIRNIITEHYSYYGFQINDMQGYSRFRTYAKTYGIELPDSDNELRRHIIFAGTLIKDTVYVFAHDDIQNMICEAEDMLKSSGVIYFRELESFIEDSNLYHNLNNVTAVREILSDYYSDGYIFSELLMENASHKHFDSYFEGLRFILTKYFPEGFSGDYALLRKYAERENIILSGNDKALKRETEALKH